MSSATVQKLAKPQLRGLLRSHLKLHLSIAIVGSVISAAAFKYFVADPRKKAYADFYKTYDENEHYEAMKKAGVVAKMPEFN